MGTRSRAVWAPTRPPLRRPMTHGPQHCWPVPRPWVPARTLGLGVGVVVYIRRFTEMLSGKNTSIKIQLERTNRICYLTCRSEQKLYFPVSSQGQPRPSRTARAPPPQPSGDARGAHPRRLASTLPAARNTLPGTPRGLPPPSREPLLGGLLPGRPRPAST